MPTLLKRSNGIYYAVLSAGTGRRKWVSTGKRIKSQALERFSKLADPEQEAIPSPSIHEFLAEFRAYAGTVYSAETLCVYERSFRSFIRHTGNLKLSAVTPRHVDLFKAKRLSEVSKTTINIELRTLRAAFYVAVRWKVLGENPFKQVKLCQIDQDTPAYLSPKDFMKLLSVVAEEEFRDLCLIAALTGLRKGELLNLRQVDVDLPNRILYVRSHGKFRTKWGKKRIVPMHPQVVGVLSRRLKESPGEFVFSVSCHKMGPHAVSMRFKRYVRRAKLDERLHFHSLRHYAEYRTMPGGTGL